MLLFAADIKIAGSLSLAVSLPTMLVAFARYSQDKSFDVIRSNKQFVIVMSLGSIVGAILGGLILGVVPNSVLIPALAVLLVLSSIKVWQHDEDTGPIACQTVGSSACGPATGPRVGRQVIP